MMASFAAIRGPKGRYGTPPRDFRPSRLDEWRPALRYRQPLGDKDIRDSWARGKGSAFDENLPAFLDRRGGSAIVLRDAA